MIWRRVTSGKTISHSINCSSVDTTIVKANCFWSNFTRWLKSSFQKANSIFSSCSKLLHGTSLLLGWRPKSLPWHIGNMRMRPPVWSVILFLPILLLSATQAFLLLGYTLSFLTQSWHVLFSLHRMLSPSRPLALPPLGSHSHSPFRS